ncbi:MAG: YraN family protein [Phycisphaerae bacterium]|nr:YraN family protein [Phycisphaerae bacterium]
MWPFRRKGKTPPARDNHDHSGASGTSENSSALGLRGEKLAARHLRRADMKILATNYRCPGGEIDIIALDKSADAIVFVEVKTRSADTHTAPESAVNADKQRRLRKAGQFYLGTHNTQNRPARFDVVSIVIRPTETPDIRHIVEAF